VRGNNRGHIFFLGFLADALLPAGEVVVEAPQGVAEERWIPVFM